MGIEGETQANATEEKRSVTVRIFGSEYPIAGVEDPALVEDLARRVDATMTEVSKNSGLLSAGKVAVLAALNIAEELMRMRRNQQKMTRSLLIRLQELSKKIDKHLQT